MKSILFSLFLSCCAPTVIQASVGSVEVPAQLIVGKWGCELGVGGIFVEFDFNYDGRYEQRSYDVGGGLITIHQGYYEINHNGLVLIQRKELDKVWKDVPLEIFFAVKVIDQKHISFSENGFSLELIKGHSH